MVLASKTTSGKPSHPSWESAVSEAMIAVVPLAHPAKNPVPSCIGTLNVNGVFASITKGLSVIVVGAVVAAAEVSASRTTEVGASRTTVVSLTFDELFVQALSAPANSNRVAKLAFVRRASNETVVISSDYVVLRCGAVVRVPDSMPAANNDPIIAIAT
jgi:hypothetical protein